jgi:hypothetical protein
LRKAQRNHRLNVQNILSAVGRPDTEIEVFLNGNADQAGYQILRRVSERIGVGCGGRGILRANLSSLRADGSILGK